MATSEAAIHKTLNLWVSRIIPVILIGIVGYVTWVVAVLICVDYLLKPPVHNHAPRHGAAIAILTFYFIFFSLMASTYFRLLFVILFDSGYTPRGPQWHQQQKIKKREHSTIGEKTEEEASKSSDDVTGIPYLPSNRQDGPLTTESAPSLHEFISRDAFVCKGDGRPRWCSQCLNWKSDRVRHCREVDRCVRKMDHFCPWVGGVISQTSFKFFIQFTSWTAVFCLFNLITIAIYLNESRRTTGNVNIHWIVSAALAGLFFIFSLGMSGSSLQLVFLNVTTIENLSRKTIVWDLAVHVPQPLPETPTFPTITFSAGQATTPTHGQNADAQPSAMKTYAILHSKLGENPWDLGAFRNFKTVMGDHFYDWLLPIRRSPCSKHSSVESEYEFGPVVERMKKEAGISLPEREEEIGGEDEKGRRRRSRHKRRRRKRSPRGDTPTGVGGTLRTPYEQTAGPPDAADIV